MSDFITLLERFNRKERFFLVLRATGQDKLTLSANFRKQLGNKVGVEVPEYTYAATDYHLDWLAASVAAYQSGLTEKEYIGKPFPNHGEQKTVKGSQEDIDLLVAFKEKGTDSHHVILVEAKGYEYWRTSQLNSKAERLKRIFPSSNGDGIKTHFCLISPNRPRKLSIEQVEGWPKWMHDGSEPHWIRLDVPAKRLEVTRIDGEGQGSKQGEKFKILQGGLRTGTRKAD